jgi:hypothetical protein
MNAGGRESVIVRPIVLARHHPTIPRSMPLPWSLGSNPSRVTTTSPEGVNLVRLTPSGEVVVTREGLLPSDPGRGIDRGTVG